MSLTAEQRLAELGLTMQIAHDFVMGHLDDLASIVQIARAYGITNTMLGEIAAYPNGAYSPEIVKAFCANYGFDTAVLDLPPGEVKIISVSEASVTEGGTLVHTVVLSQAATSIMGGDAIISGGTLSSADYGTVTATNGVTITNGGISIPVGVSSFEIHIPTIDDALQEPTETASFYLAQFAAHITVTDNDAPVSTGLVDYVGDPTVTEGVAMNYLVALKAATTAVTELSFALVPRSASAADIGAPTFTDGVTLVNDHIVVPAGLQYFSVIVPSVDDAIHEEFETVICTIGGVSGTGYIADNDNAPSASVDLVGMMALNDA